MATILVVDDDELFRSLISSIFNEDHIVLEAENGLRAICQFEQHQPDLIITDLSMPVMSGLDFIINIRATNSRVKIIAISSLFERPEEGKILLAAGADL